MLDTAVTKKILAALVALSIGIAVYLFDRNGDAYFLPFAMGEVQGLPSVFGRWGHHLPSFVHVYAFILFTAACLPAGRLPALGACFAWLLIECLFEIGQHPLLAHMIAPKVPPWFRDVPILEVFEDYLLIGRFDPLDILAAVLGAAAAWLTISIINPKEGA